MFDVCRTNQLGPRTFHAAVAEEAEGGVLGGLEDTVSSLGR